jgi:hydrogenase-4 component F
VPYALVLLPAAVALVLFLAPGDALRLRLLPALGLAHLALTGAALAGVGGAPAPGAWLALDPLGGCFLLLESGLFLMVSLYAPAYLRLRAERPVRAFSACLALFLAMASAVALAQHLGLLWVAVSGSTLASAPLIYFNRNRLSIEATWKFLMLGSVGIALALLGSFFLAYAAHLGGQGSSLLFARLEAGATELSRPWLRAAFVLFLVGYGTKMGIAPLHTWKPDAYGEAPGLAGALMSGGATHCAFLALLRAHRVVALGGEAVFARRLLVGMGLLSIAYVAVFMARQRDVKRLLAYSSIEQMGILLLGVGVGAGFATLLHALNNAVTKAWMFLSVANVHRAFGTKRVADLSGAARVLPVSGAMLLLGMLAVAGMPPFGPFVSLFGILDGAVGGGHPVAAAGLLAGLAVIFLGMGATVVKVVGGAAAPVASGAGALPRDDWRMAGPILVAAAVSLVLGTWLPAPLEALLAGAAAQAIGGAP